MIVAQDLSVEYSSRRVLDSVNLSLDRGLHLVLGRNGSGKTTLLKAIAGIVKPSRGRVTVFGRDVHRLPRREAVKLVGYAWQNPYAGFVESTVEEELEFSARLLNTSLNYEIVEILVPRHLLGADPFSLSGGEAKRVSMASVLAVDQPAWLLDEPFEYLDSDGVRSVKSLIEYGIERGKIIVISSASTSYLHMFRPSTVSVLVNGELFFKPIEELSDSALAELGIPSREMICGIVDRP